MPKAWNSTLKATTKRPEMMLKYLRNGRQYLLGKLAAAVPHRKPATRVRRWRNYETINHTHCDCHNPKHVGDTSPDETT